MNLINDTILEKKLLNIKKRVSVFSERDMFINLYWSSSKVPVNLVRFHWLLKFLKGFSKNTQISNIPKILPVGVELFHENGRADRHDKANSRFRKFTKTPKNIVNKYGLYTSVSEFLTLSCALVRLTVMSSLFSLDHNLLVTGRTGHLYLLS